MSRNGFRVRTAPGGRASGAIALLAAALLVTACAPAQPGGQAAPGGQPSQPRPVVLAPSSFNSTDLAWMQLMIPMNEQMLPTLDLAAQRGDPALRALATGAKPGFEAELARLRELRDLSGLPSTNIHAGHNMPGMVTEERLAQLTAASDAEFSRLCREFLREHLDQTARLARSEQDAGTDPAVKQLAGTVEQARLAQRTQLDLP